MKYTGALLSRETLAPHMGVNKPGDVSDKIKDDLYVKIYAYTNTFRKYMFLT